MNNKKEKKYKINVGENVRMWREFKGLKQEDLAKRLDVEACTLSKIENEKSFPNTHMLQDIAEALEIEIDQLFHSPQNFYSLNNSPKSVTGKIHGTQNVYNIDKEFLEKIIILIDKVSHKLPA